MARILLVDNEPNILSVLTSLLRTEGYEVTPVREPDKALSLVKAEQFDLMVSDIRMTPMDGMQLLRSARAEQPGMCVIMLTAYGTVETAIESLKLGAFDYVTKPFKADELLITIERALDYSRALKENVDLRSQLDIRRQFENIVAESVAMRNVCEMIQRVAPTDATVLIYGESGTGKELVAKAIHANSRRKDRNFLAVNCAALPEPLLESEMFGHVKGSFTGASSDKKGLFEAANGGTIFLDEIGSMSLGIQGKLLRVLQEREVRRVGSNETVPVDVRVLTATNMSLEKLISQGTFREDLYYRLSVIPIEIKPLRERRDDIMPLAYHFIRSELGPGKELPAIDRDVRDVLEQYDWPGNVRELENALKHGLTFLKEGKITCDVLPPKILASVQKKRIEFVDTVSDEGFRWRSLKEFLRAKEREYLEQVLSSVGGDKEKAAKALRISLATLYRKLPEEGSEGSTGENPP